mmetsp:Transcript_7527/g.8220  ORF Transcript_7527/g.8220 Transcript_7527/m.8220 type:complete len:188 (-) Transcript_7527:110-673(-)
METQSQEKPSLKSLASRRSHAQYMTLISDEKYPVLYKCTLCGSNLTREYSLRLHILSHFRVKRHRCDVCNKRYSSRQSLKEHQLIHSTEGSMRCPHDSCGRRFRRRIRLVYHLRASGHGDPNSVSLEYDHEVSSRTEKNSTPKKEQIFKISYEPLEINLLARTLESFDLNLFLESPLPIPSCLLPSS